MTEIEEFRGSIEAAAASARSLAANLRLAAAKFRGGELDDETIIGLAMEGSESPTLALLARMEKALEDALNAAREERKEVLLALHRAKSNQEEG